MGADASVYGLVGRGVTSFNEYQAQDHQNQVNALQLQTARQGVADDNALRAATQQFGTDAAMNRNLLASTGNYKALGAYDKAQLDAAESRAKVTKETAQTGLYGAQTTASQLEQSVKSHDFAVQKLGAINDPMQAAAWIAEQEKTGVFTPEQAGQGRATFLQALQKPGGFDAWKSQAMQGGMTVTQQLSAKLEAQKAAEAARHNVSTEALTGRGQDMTAQTAAAGHAITMRGQNMTDARTRESTSATMSKPFEVTGPDGTPQLVQQDKQGNITPVQGFGPKAGASKPLNDSQAKALLFGTRMQEAEKVLGGLQGKYSPAAINAKNGAEAIGGITGAIGSSVGNMMLSTESQQAEQAQRDFINAVLRRESGAAIAPSEFANASKQYFDQPNDKPEVKAQKAANRKLSISGLLAEVPAGQRTAITPVANSPHPPDITDLLTKYGKK